VPKTYGMKTAMTAKLYLVIK